MGAVSGDYDDNRDKLIEHYDSILRESSLLTTVAGILFGFLLNVSVNLQLNLMRAIKCYC
jgi:hypothetical protein